MLPRCPRCNEEIMYADSVPTEISYGRKNLKGLLITCPNSDCNTVLGCMVDPIAQQAGLVRKLTDALGSLLKKR